MMRQRKKTENYLDWIPKKNPDFETRMDKKGQVMIQVVHKGVMYRLTQILLGKPKATWVHLDKMGSFIWSQIDGKRTVYEIGKALQATFKDQAEPLYERLAFYIKTLEEQSFVKMRKE